MTNYIYKNDLPDELDLGPVVAIDTETMGLNPLRDRLCLVQLSSGDGHAHIVQIKNKSVKSPNICKILSDQNKIKLFHFARFDIAALQNHFKISTSPVYCTKIASKLVRTYTDRHGLKNLLREMLLIDISKQQQSSDWGAPELSKSQVEYAASDVLYLHKLMDKLNINLRRENRMEMANACFDFLPMRAELDLAGWSEHDIFSHT
ncbi:ribonuclease H-like domain-containing protein [Amylibacter sp.]|nr:ribonuclease H-like domain-containing protein [Amylibacter sp.]